MNLDEVLVAIESQTDTTFVFERSYDHGLNDGAILLRDSDGGSAVLKIWNDRSLAWATDCKNAVNQARSANWPSPAWRTAGTLADGRTFGLQDVAEGIPVSVIDDKIARQIVLADQYRQMILLDDPSSAREIFREEIESAVGPERFFACFAFRVIDNLS